MTLITKDLFVAKTKPLASPDSSGILFIRFFAGEKI
jgi:hypothetical protein